MIYYYLDNSLIGTISSFIERIFGECYPAGKYSRVKKLLNKHNIKVKTTTKQLKTRDLLLAHTKELVEDLKSPLLLNLDGTTLEESELGAYSSIIGMYFSGVSYATNKAAETAIKSGAAANIGGGYHHSKSSMAGAFCPINDIAISIKKLRKERRIKRALVIDLDCHQGNGNAEIFKKDKNTYVFSIHKNNVYPMGEGLKSDKDIAIGRSKSKFFASLKSFLEKFNLKKFKPDIIYYIAGADSYKDDEWTDGGLGLSKTDLKKRDKMVYEYAKDNKIPIVTVLGGGYANIKDVSEIHFNTLQLMTKIFK